MSWILAFIGFALLILLHEAGHFAAAKAVGMRVERFSLFFPPLIAKKKVGETEYAIGAVPLGGYVKITGMNPAEPLDEEVRPRAYFNQPVWKRIVVIAAGPAVNLVLALLLLWVYFAFIGASTPSNNVAAVQSNTPAAAALEPGDRILAVDGRRGEPEVIRQAISSHTCAERPPTDGCRAAEPAELLVERDGRQVTVEAAPVYDAGLRRTVLGFQFGSDGPRATVPVGEAVAVSADRFWLITRETLALPARLLDSERRREISSVVGGYETTRQYIISDIATAVAILAIISLSLGLINLFPFLPLDGGHIFWALVEKVRRKPVAYTTMERAGVVGFALVIMLFLVGLTNDIDRLAGEGFGVPR